MLKIKNIYEKQILSLTGNIAYEVTMRLENGIRETVEIAYYASLFSDLKNIRHYLIDIELDQSRIDNILFSLVEKQIIYRNASICVSELTLRCLARVQKRELYEFISATGQISMPIPMINMISGNTKYNSDLDIAEFMIVPMVSGIKKRIEMSSSIYQNLKQLLEHQDLSDNTYYDGSFIPKISNNKLALDLLVKAIKQSGYVPGKDVYLAINMEASLLYLNESDCYDFNHSIMSVDQMISYYEMLVEYYPIMAIMNPFQENDFYALHKLTNVLKDKILIVGGKHFKSSPSIFQNRIQQECGNAINIKLTEVTTITEMFELLVKAKRNAYQPILEHTNKQVRNSLVPLLSIGFQIPYIKFGSIAGQQTENYNTLIKIEERLK